jgi:hypothetical protein
VLSGSDDDADQDKKPPKKKVKHNEADETLTMLREVIDASQAQLAARLKLEESRLEMERQREAREVRRLETQEKERVEARQKDLWDRAMKMSAHPNPIVQAKGEKMLLELEAQEGL